MGFREATFIRSSREATFIRSSREATFIQIQLEATFQPGGDLHPVGAQKKAGHNVTGFPSLR
jgi:hypothetical protein